MKLHGYTKSKIIKDENGESKHNNTAEVLLGKCCQWLSKRFKSHSQ